MQRDGDPVAPVDHEPERDVRAQPEGGVGRVLVPVEQIEADADVAPVGGAVQIGDADAWPSRLQRDRVTIGADRLGGDDRPVPRRSGRSAGDGASGWR